MRNPLSPPRLAKLYTKLASRYDFQHGLLTAGSDARGRRLVVEHAVRAGDKILDAGAGTASTSLLAARKTGSSGHVTVFDFSDGMLAAARKKISDPEIAKRLDYRCGDMLALPFADASFDTVLSTYSLCPLFKPEDGALELYRVLKPGGRLGVAHSVSPEGPVMHWLAERLEDVVWLAPSLSMGCRAVSVLPILQTVGARLLFKKQLGVPLYPFLVFVVKKPSSNGAQPDAAVATQSA